MTMRFLVREVCEAYQGLTPNDVGDMTFYQLRELLWPKEELRGYRRYQGQYGPINQSGGQSGGQPKKPPLKPPKKARK